MKLSLAWARRPLLAGLLGLAMVTPALAIAPGRPSRPEVFTFGSWTVPGAQAASADDLEIRLTLGPAASPGNVPLAVEIRGPSARSVAHVVATLSMPSMPIMGEDRYVLARDPLDQYVSAPMISMPGIWQVKIQVDLPGEHPATASFAVDFKEPSGSN